MKKITVALLVSWMAWCIHAAEAEWMTDLPKAQAKAKAEKKLVLMDFTGSDWCPPCKALHKNVFSSSEFANYANSNLVLVEVDFPRSKQQSQELKKANAGLGKQFNIEGYPTVLVLSQDGKQLMKEVGYEGDDAKKFIGKVEKLKK